MTVESQILTVPDIVKTFDKVSIPAGQRVFSQGQACDHYTIIASGSVRVLTRSPDGRELVLYHISPGEICVLTTACLMGGTRYPAEAITHTNISAYIIPGQEFDRLVAESKEFREFVFNSFSHRLADLMIKLENVALESIDSRLISYLNTAKNTDGDIKTTHQEIADEIGSAREVISRHLKTLEKQGKIHLSRGNIHIIDL